ncbi:metallophosphoesterase [Jeotgalicoccus huakuii]|uniref:metallophosphoesterase n=1 Tax=Jeotgalicoccus TaxID=227979 RepID=UPI0003FF4AA2|nr:MULTISPECIES: metallophosphoesterase [Jeotgalicoccus]MCK1975893.1 metallophosphoesterase [Jeotgalicoccus huakuii]QQD84822.1 metallophosphoesterase [Jeotgalicoccus sp. ATCC 8456]
MSILRKLKITPLILGFTIALARFLWKEDKHIITTKYQYKNKNIPSAFDGYRIIQVSDYHNAFFGRSASNLLRAIKKANPDVIFITGDVIDRRTPFLKRSKTFIEKVTNIQDAYYVTGNHEADYTKFHKLYEIIGNSDVVNVTKKAVELEHRGEKINLTGVSDVWFFGDEENIMTYRNFSNEIKKNVNNLPHNFTILLAHRPELLSIYSKNPVDLVFCGHAHGGQIRLPIVKGLYAPHQGVNPKYTEGLYEKDGTTMVVSRGLGNSRFPFRVFNHPELVVVELKKEY